MISFSCPKIRWDRVIRLMGPVRFFCESDGRCKEIESLISTRLNFIGTARPALTVLSSGRLLTREKNSLKSQTTSHEPTLPYSLSCDRSNGYLFQPLSLAICSHRVIFPLTATKDVHKYPHYAN